LYDLDVDAQVLPARCHVEAWSPGLPGLREVFHAHLVDYAYPSHCHDVWAVLIVDDGAIRYDLDRRECLAARPTVTILPPGVPHDGRPAPGAGRLTRALTRPAAPSRQVARELRELLDARYDGDVSLAQAAALLDRSVPHLVRSFTREFGLSPHAYVTGRRIDAARRHLLAGMPAAEVAAAVGFYDQAHLTRHFKRHTSVTPAAYARSHARK
jgi:AraC-like DNA-binding protein